MRFLVDLYRLLIVGMCGLILVGVIFIALSVVTSSGAVASLSGPVLLGCATALVFLVLSLGGVAILMSLHDRHIELVEQITAVAEASQRVAAAVERQPLMPRGEA